MQGKSPFPVIDLSGYLASPSSAAAGETVRDVANACREHGFFQVKGHGIPLETQKALLQSIGNVFDLPAKEKLELSFLNSPCRRGYEAHGLTIRDGDVEGDSKECYYVGPDDPVVEMSGFYGPNVWPELPADQFRGPVWDYYQRTRSFGKTVWEILLQGLGASPRLVDTFAQRPLAPMKMCRYPPAGGGDAESAEQEQQEQQQQQQQQHGAQAHTDFAGLTILLQEPNKQCLEVWHDEQWAPVPAREDVIVVIIGDMTKRWTGGRYRSAPHRVINRTSGPRHSCATFWQGDVFATNPLNALDKETVGQGLVRRFRRQFMLDHVVDEVEVEAEEDEPQGAAMDELDLGQDGQLVFGGCVVS